MTPGLGPHCKPLSNKRDLKLALIDFEMNKFIFNFSDVLCICKLFLISNIKICNKQGRPDQMHCSVKSDLGPHCLHLSGNHNDVNQIPNMLNVYIAYRGPHY